jgi:hypothetical protein
MRVEEGTMRLTEYEWNILDELQEQDEPFEVIDSSLAQRFEVSTPQRLLEAVYRLYRLELVSIQQSPIKALGQAFMEKTVQPGSALECFGDLKAEYDKYFASRNNPGKKPAGKKKDEEPTIPRGIWIDITESGQSEYDLDDYMEFWPNSPGQEET